MAKKALVEKANRKPKFKVRGYTAASGAAVRVRYCAPSVCAVSASGRWHTAASCPASPRAPVALSSARFNPFDSTHNLIPTLYAVGPQGTPAGRHKATR